MPGLIALFALFLAHGPSRSFASWTIDGSRAEARVAFATHDIAGVADVAALVSSSTRVSVRGASCRVVRSGATVLGDETMVVVEFWCPAYAEELDVEALYLPPPHTTLASFTAGAIEAQHIFTPESPRVHLVLEKEPNIPWWPFAVFGAVTLGFLALRAARSGRRAS